MRDKVWTQRIPVSLFPRILDVLQSKYILPCALVHAWTVTEGGTHHRNLWLRFNIAISQRDQSPHLAFVMLSEGEGIKLLMDKIAYLGVDKACLL